MQLSALPVQSRFGMIVVNPDFYVERALKNMGLTLNKTEKK